MAFVMNGTEMTKVVIDGAVMNDVFVDGELVYSKRTLNLHMKDASYINNNVDVLLGGSGGTEILSENFQDLIITATDMQIPGATLLEFNFVSGNASYTHVVTDSSTLTYTSENAMAASNYEVVYLAAL